MIFDVFLDLMLGMVSWFLDWTGESPAAQITFTMDDLVTPWVAGLSSLGAWVPWGAIVFCAPIVTGAYILFFGLRFLRMLIGHVPQFGGNG